MHFGVDGISLFFVLLTTLLVPICLAGSISNRMQKPNLFAANFLLMESLILVAFTVLDMTAFYAAFEGILIPMFLLIGI